MKHENLFFIALMSYRKILVIKHKPSELILFYVIFSALQAYKIWGFEKTSKAIQSAVFMRDSPYCRDDQI